MKRWNPQKLLVKTLVPEIGRLTLPIVLIRFGIMFNRVSVQTVAPLANLVTVAALTVLVAPRGPMAARRKLSGSKIVPAQTFRPLKKLRARMGKRKYFLPQWNLTIIVAFLVNRRAVYQN